MIKSGYLSAWRINRKNIILLLSVLITQFGNANSVMRHWFASDRVQGIKAHCRLSQINHINKYK